MNRCIRSQCNFSAVVSPTAENPTGKLQPLNPHSALAETRAVVGILEIRQRFRLTH